MTTDDEASEVADDDAAIEADHPDTTAITVAPRRAWPGSRLGAVLAAALLAATAAAGSVYWWLYRPDLLTDQAAQQEVLAAAKSGAEAVLTYAPESVDQDLADAKSHLTGDFLQKYSDFADTVVGPATRERGVKTEATVARVAVSSMQPGRAEVLAFVNQVTTSKERPTPALATSSVIITLVRTGGSWLISEFNPV